MEIRNLNEARAVKAEDNTLWTPKDCAEAFLRDIEGGVIKPTKVLILYTQEAADGSRTISADRAKMTREDEIVTLSHWLHRSLHSWATITT